MAIRVSAATTEGIYTLYQWGAMGNWTDSQLVAQFLTGQEGSEAAFRTLIHRHGPMVLGVCRRVLGDEHAAEDAFQATFLVLVKKANAFGTPICSRIGFTVWRSRLPTRRGSRGPGGGPWSVVRRDERWTWTNVMCRSNCDR